MDLRHKKPINSYRGQANNDRNEFNDDDFKHQPSPAKKLNNSNGEQTHKYWKILTKFIMNSNQFYLQKQRNPKKQKTQIQHLLEDAKAARDQSKIFQISKKPQQPKQKRKIISKIQNEILQQKQQKQRQPSKKESQLNVQKNASELKSQKPLTKNFTLKDSILNTDALKQKTELLTAQKIENIVPQNFTNMYNQNIPMNDFPNPAVFTNMTMNQYIECYKQMRRVAMLQQMIKNEQLKAMDFNSFNPQFMAGLMMNAQQNNIGQSMYQNYARDNLQMTMPVVKKNPPINDLTQLFLQKKQSIFNHSKQHPNRIAKGASFHIGIAYHIYLNRLEKNGADITDIQTVDPTRQSRQIKQKDKFYRKNTKTRSQK